MRYSTIDFCNLDRHYFYNRAGWGKLRFITESESIDGADRIGGKVDQDLTPPTLLSVCIRNDDLLIIQNARESQHTGSSNRNAKTSAITSDEAKVALTVAQCWLTTADERDVTNCPIERVVAIKGMLLAPQL